MKYRTTQKDVKSGYNKTICVSYGALQNLLKWHDPIAYTSRREGWGADIYHFGSVAIVTGYSPFGNVKPDYSLIREYDQKAAAIREEVNDYMNGYEKQKEMLDNLIREFIKAATGIETAA